MAPVSACFAETSFMILMVSARTSSCYVSTMTAREAEIRKLIRKEKYKVAKNNAREGLKK